MPLAGIKVLLAEDNPTNQLVAQQMLETLGASVRVANDGLEALDMLERERFDVVLIDIEMPRMSGLELIRRLRAAGDWRAELPLIALTAYVMREHRAAIDASGADGVIAKPILSIKQFGADIKRFMRKRGCTVPGDRPAEAGEVPLIDCQVYEDLAAAVGADAMAELLDKVNADISSARDRLLQAVTGPLDLESVRSATHVLISVAGAIGAVRVERLARKINDAAHQEAGTIASDVPTLIAEIDRLKEALAEGVF